MATTYQDVACTRCGCVCDDLCITVNDGRIVDTVRACELAERWFLDQGKDEPPVASIEGRPADFDEAANHAANILANSHSPLIYGLSRSSTDGQRAAVRLADRIGATIDTTASRCHAPSILAFQQVGESTCTLGEARNRCDLVVFWGCDPMNSHPRHGERYSVDPPGLFLPRGREDRYVIVIDAHRTDSAQMADWFIQPDKGSDFEVICALRYLLQNGDIANDQIGLPIDDLRSLVERLRSCRSGIVYFGLGLAKSKTGHATVESLLRLVKDLNSHTRFYAQRMRIPGDVTGADSVLCWQTGYPFAVNLARGYPRYNPGEYTANEMLERKEVDACLFVGSEGIAHLSLPARQYVDQIPTIVLDYPGTDCLVTPEAKFTTAVYGVHTTGTSYRMDEVPIPLKAILPSPYPTDHQVLARLARDFGISDKTSGPTCCVPPR